MSPQEHYLQQLTKVACQGRSDPLKALLWARLTGTLEPIAGIRSPPLSRDEPDASLLLIHLYTRLAPAAAARDYLRYSAAELLMDLLPDPATDAALLTNLGRLVGSYQVASAPALAARLHWQLWGLLRDGLERPLQQLMHLSGSALARATQVLDLWLAVTPPLSPTVTELQKKAVEELFNHSIDTIRNHLSEPHGQLLLLTFRALLKVDPGQAGKIGVLAISRLIDEVNGRHQEALLRHWDSQCWELGIVMGQPERGDWLAQFKTGLTRIEHQREYQQQFSNTFWQSLKTLGNLHEFLASAWAPTPLPTQQRPMLSLVAGGGS